MAEKQRTYFCIDMKSFYASVECAERGWNPFETNLVVADLTRGRNALCLAITPKMKTLGIKNRCRLSDIPKDVHYEVAPPRMALYIEYAADIYSMYLDYIAPEDIHVYSIDESFLDVTDYLPTYHMDAFAFAKFLMNEIANRYPTSSSVTRAGSLLSKQRSVGTSRRSCRRRRSSRSGRPEERRLSCTASMT